MPDQIGKILRPFGTSVRQGLGIDQMDRPWTITRTLTLEGKSVDIWYLLYLFNKDDRYTNR